MNKAPDHILKAALQVLHVCAYTTRNWTTNDSVSRQQLNDLWEAVHAIPSLLTRWRPDAEKELLLYLDEYASKWADPDIKGCYFQARDSFHA